MKKIVTVILVCFCFSSVFAQGEKTAAEIATGKVGAEITRRVQEGASQAARVEQMVRSMDFGAALHYTDHAMQLSELEAARVPEVADLSSASNVQNALENAPKKSLHLQEKLANLKRVIWKKRATELFSPSAPQVRLAQITNLPGQPAVQVRLDSPSTLSSSDILPARVLPSIQIYKSISLVRHNQLYLPRAFTETKNVLYRGMRFTNLSDLENLLLQGMEIRSTGYSEIYFGYIPSTALGYALPWKVDENVNGEFPVVTKVPVTPQLPVLQTGVTAQVYKDLPAEFISDVMVFLEINGRADWYKAIMENNKLVLISVPTTQTSGYFSRWMDP